MVGMNRRYFAYGSNMSSVRLLARVPDAVPLGAARLDGWRLAFDKPSRDGSAKANIAPVVGAVVWGVTWSLPERAWSTLDAYEPGYQRTECPVTDGAGQGWAAITYVYRGPVTDAPPFDWYVEHLLVGAREHRLPDLYQQSLAALRGRATATG